MNRNRGLLRIGFALLSCVSAALAETLSVVGYNVESGGAQADTVAQRIAEMQGVHVWGFCEVANEDWARTFAAAAADGEGGATFEYAFGTTGAGDRMAIVYSTARLEKLRHFELHHINVSGTVRAPLVAEFRDKSTNERFFFTVNHLYRGNAAGRHEQARLLNQWAAGQSLPVIAVGDYNFDWEVVNGEVAHDRGYDEMTASGVFGWVRPATLVKSQCSERYNSVLDFVFVSGTAQTWPATAEIVVKAGDCPDDERTSDHRPMRATFTVGSEAPADPTHPTTSPATTDARLAALLVRVRALEAELKAVREELERLVGP